MDPAGTASSAGAISAEPEKGDATCQRAAPQAGECTSGLRLGYLNLMKTKFALLAHHLLSKCTQILMGCLSPRAGSLLWHNKLLQDLRV